MSEDRLGASMEILAQVNRINCVIPIVQLEYFFVVRVTFASIAPAITDLVDIVMAPILAREGLG